MRLASPVRVATLVATTALAAGCGDGLKPRADERARNLVSPGAISELPAGTPGRALLRWWRDVQFANLTGFTAGLDGGPAAVAAEPTLETLSLLAGAVRPEIRGVERRGARVVVRTTLRARQPVGNVGVVVAERSFPFAMRRARGSWRVSGGVAFARELERTLRPLAGGNSR